MKQGIAMCKKNVGTGKFQKIKSKQFANEPQGVKES